jgi:hypothetical protein
MIASWPHRDGETAWSEAVQIECHRIARRATPARNSECASSVENKRVMSLDNGLT